MRATISSLVLCVSLMAAPSMAADEGGYALKPDHKMSAVLKDMNGKRVTLHLKKGGELTGKIAVVGDHLVQLSTLANKDFFDAVVAVDAIAAVEFRARNQ